MLMKIATYVSIALLVVTLGAGAFFYLNVHTPMAEDYVRMKAGMPELDKAKIELKKYKEKENRESRETAWLSPVIDVLSAGFSEEIKSGKAEVLAAGNKVIVNIAEQALFMPGSYTFAQESPQLRANLAALLKNDKIKGRDIYIGNTTQGVPAQGKGRKKIPAKDARTLAAERSAALIKDFEKNGVNQDALIATAYAAKQPQIGFNIKDRKTVIIIESPPTLPVVATKHEAAKPAPDAKNAAAVPVTPSAQAQPKSIPIKPAPKAP
jgi:hypothetical protein